MQQTNNRMGCAALNMDQGYKLIKDLGLYDPPKDFYSNVANAQKNAMQAQIKGNYARYGSYFGIAGSALVKPNNKNKRRLRFICGQWMEITDRRHQYEERLKTHLQYNKSP